MWHLLFAFLEPFVESLGDNDAAFLLLHGIPHTTIFTQGVITAVDCLHHGAEVGISFGPKWDETLES